MFRRVSLLPHLQEGVYGFDSLEPHKPPEPVDNVYSHLSVTPGKDNSPRGSPGASHSPSPAGPPADDEVMSVLVHVKLSDVSVVAGLLQPPGGAVAWE